MKVLFLAALMIIGLAACTTQQPVAAPNLPATVTGQVPATLDSRPTATSQPTYASYPTAPTASLAPSTAEAPGQLLDAIHDCFGNDPAFAEFLVAGMVADGASQQLAELVAGDRELFREVTLRGIHPDPAGAEVLTSLAPLLEQGCGL